MNSWYSETRAWALELTHFLSQTDTAGEREFGTFLKDRLSTLLYFQENPGNLLLARTQNDLHERYVLLALVKGTGRATVILTGHYDVVGVGNYGELEEWACDPEALLPRLIAALRAEDAKSPGLSPTDQLALEDLCGGEFLPGRGLLDMKSGLAAGLSVLERYSRMPGAERQGNLLFIAVPDEEIASNGARTVGGLLPDQAQKWNLDFQAAINLDASDDHGDGSHGQAVFLGSIGKLLPSVLVVGRETHAGSPFNGINANLLAAEITRRIECNPSLSDNLGGTYTVPPTCLKQADTKGHYDVTTPTTAWCYYNWLILQQPVDSVLDILIKLVGEALSSAIAGIQAKAAQFSCLAGYPLALTDWRPQVYTFTQVKELALQRGGSDFQHKIQVVEQQLSSDPGLDTPTCCQRLTETVWSASGLKGPAAIVGFAAIFYPPVSLDGLSTKAERLYELLASNAEAIRTQEGASITLFPFFPGISDISFLGGRVAQGEIDVLSSNTPLWESRVKFDYFGASKLNFPVVNIGPWGRDYHQRLERVYTPYSFETLPDYLWRVVSETLSSPK